MLDELYVAPSLPFDLCLEKLFEEVKIFDDGIDLIAVESERLFQFVEDTDKVDDKAVRLDELLLFVLIRAVHSRDRLQQGVVTHRLVEIHGVENRRVKTGQELLRDNEDFGLLAEPDKTLPDTTLFLFVDVKLLQFDGVVVIGRINDFGVFWRQKLIEQLFVIGARLPVHRDKKRLVTQRLNVALVMIRDKARHFPHARLALEKVFKSNGPVEDLVQFFDIGDAFSLGEGKELLLHDLMGHQQRVGGQAVEERQGRAVINALGN